MDALGDNAARGHSAGHENVVHQRLTVDRHADGLTHLGVDVLVGVVKLHVVVAEVGIGAELRIALIEQHVGGSQVHAVDFARLIRVERSRGIGDDLVIDAVELHVLGVPILVVLHEGCAHAHIQAGRDERAAVEQVIRARGEGVALLGVEFLVEREQAAQRQQAVKEGSRGGKRDDEGFVVHGLDAHLARVHFAVQIRNAVLDERGDDVGVAVVVRVADFQQPAELEVLRGQRRAVAPNQTVAKREGVGQAVFRDGVALGQRRLRVMVLIQTDKTLGNRTDYVHQVGVGTRHLVEGAENAVGVDMKHVVAVGESGRASKKHERRKSKRQDRLFHNLPPCNGFVRELCTISVHKMQNLLYSF